MLYYLAAGAVQASQKFDNSPDTINKSTPDQFQDNLNIFLPLKGGQPKRQVKVSPRSFRGYLNKKALKRLLSTLFSMAYKLPPKLLYIPLCRRGRFGADKIWLSL